VSEEKTHQVHIKCKFTHDSGKSIEHVLTIGADDQPLPAGYGKAELQRDVDAFKQKHAELFASKIHAAEIAAQLED
jgi:hypothetical protein